MDCERDCHVIQFIQGKKDIEPNISPECMDCVVFQYRISQQLSKLVKDEKVQDYHKEQKKFIEGK